MKMALQIAGTTVINNSRGLENITNLKTVGGQSLLGSGDITAGGSINDIFYENGQTVTTNYTIGTNRNAMSAGPITVNNGITVTVPNNSTWTIV
jgi:hypothetical protein